MAIRSVEQARAWREKLESLLPAVEDAAALSVADLFPAWVAGASYPAGARVRQGEALYKCVQAHTAQPDWTPSAAPALWAAVSAEAWPLFVQPTGAHDAYSAGDRVTYNGVRYVCTYDGNVYAPDAYPAGWEVA